MATALEELNEPIVAIACEDRKGDCHLFYCEPHLNIKQLDFQDDILLIENFALVYDWFSKIIVCTEETLQELKQELQNA